MQAGKWEAPGECKTDEDDCETAISAQQLQVCRCWAASTCVGWRLAGTGGTLRSWVVLGHGSIAFEQDLFYRFILVPHFFSSELLM